MSRRVLTLLALPMLVPAQELTLQEVATGVHAVISPPGHDAGANAAFVVLEDAVLVIDTHMVPSAARATLVTIRSTTSLPVRYVVNTHWHPDHTQGDEAYAAAYEDAIFISHHTTREDIATLGARRLARDQRERPELREVDLVLPNLTFSQSLRLNGGSREIQILYFGRGHTRGDAVVLLPREKIAFVGDLVTGGPPFARDGYPLSWIQTLRALRELDIEHIVTGHGRIWRGKQVLDDRIRFLEHAISVIRAGGTAEEIASAIDLDAFRDTFEPEPAHRPWRDWMLMLAERGLAELGEH